MRNKELKDQLTTFFVGKELFGLEVMKVQEVTGALKCIEVPLAPEFVQGLVNLRGQIATAVDLGELFYNRKTNLDQGQMSVVCRMEGNLISLVVSSIGDVIEIDKEKFEHTPDTVPTILKKFIKGVYKMDGNILSVLDLEKIFQELSPIN